MKHFIAKFEGRKSQVFVLISFLIGCVNLGKLLKFPEPVSHLQNGYNWYLVIDTIDIKAYPAELM